MQLEVGKTYLNRRNDKVTIIENTMYGTFPFKCKDFVYTKTGSYFENSTSDRDLVSEFIEPTFVELQQDTVIDGVNLSAGDKVLFKNQQDNIITNLKAPPDESITLNKDYTLTVFEILEQMYDLFVKLDLSDQSAVLAYLSSKTYDRKGNTLI